MREQTVHLINGGVIRCPVYQQGNGTYWCLYCAGRPIEVIRKNGVWVEVIQGPTVSQRRRPVCLHCTTPLEPAVDDLDDALCTRCRENAQLQQEEDEVALYGN